MFKVKVTGLDEVIKKIENLKNSLDSKQHELLERLSAIGIDVASVKFKNAQYDGINDVSVDPSPEWVDEKTLVITARGQAVAFIEFGTGVHYTEQHPTADEVGATRGSYGKGNGSKDSWAYYGNPGTNGHIVRTLEDGTTVVRTHGNPPARAMYDASQAMRDKIVEIAKEIYKR